MARGVTVPAVMRIALAQIDTTIGAFEDNLEAVRRAAQQAAAQGARVLVAPELTVTGYPPRDYLEFSSFLDGANRALDRFIQSPLPRGLAIALGTVETHEGEGAGLYNAAVLIDGGRVVARARKSLLPTYSVFDEARYFDPAPKVSMALIDGVRVGLTICEDLWNDRQFWWTRRTNRDPMEDLARQGVQLVLNLSASPYALGKPVERERLLGIAARRRGIPLAMANLVGGNDALVFDGRSLAMDALGRKVVEAPGFREGLVIANLTPSRPGGTHAPPDEPPPTASPRGRSAFAEMVTPLAGELSPAQLDELHDALVLGLRDYARKTGFDGVLVGLSGGVDSALVAVLAARALGPDKVTTAAMPSRYTSAASSEDAALLAKRLGVQHLVLSIEDPVDAFQYTLAETFEGRGWDVTEENLQARVRGTMLMALSNKFGSLLLATGNKSELAVGHSTLYGDMVGGLAVIGDLSKTVVYALCRRINALSPQELIPERVLSRAPSAELRQNQTDQDTLPPYDVLDRVLRRYMEARQSAAEIAAHEPGIKRDVIDRIIELIRTSEHKRRQAPPVLRVTPRAFGEGWRFPVAHAVR